MRESQTLSDLFPAEPYKMAEISVLNWGAFAGNHTAPIDPDGTLVTGTTGAGKTSLIDAIQPLLLQTRKISFNVAAAQGEAGDRSVVSYVRGKYRESNQERGGSPYLRPGPTNSVIRMLLRSGEQALTLMAVFGFAGSSDQIADMTRTYIIAQRNLTIDELGRMAPNLDRRTMKAAVEEDEAIALYQTFEEYSKAYKKHLFMENDRAPELLCRVLGLKQIKNLTELIRDLVLDPEDKVTGIVERACSNFNDLRSIYEELKDQRDQYQHLERLPELRSMMDETRATIADLEAMKHAIPIYINRILSGYFQRRLDEVKREIEEKSHDAARLKDQVGDANDALMQATLDYMNQGGNRLNDIDVEIGKQRQDLGRIQESATSYKTLVSRLGYDATVERGIFDEVRKKIADSLLDKQQREDRFDNAFLDTRSKVLAVEGEIKGLDDEIQVARKRKASNIDTPFQDMRDQMSKGISVPVEDLVFVGELIDVKEEEEGWRGAIERALGRQKTTLIVPAESYRLANAWLNANHVRVDARIEAFERQANPATFLPDGFLRKLNWRGHHYRDALKAWLARADRHCVESPEALSQTEMSMTREGLMRDRGRSSRKNDTRRIDDRWDWQIGFDNRMRLSMLQENKAKLEASLPALRDAETRAKTNREDNSQRTVLAESLLMVSWADIDPQPKEQAIWRLIEERKALEAGNDSLEMARARKTAAEKERDRISGILTLTASALSNAEIGYRAAESALEKCLRGAAGEVTPGALADAREHVGALTYEQRNEGDAIIARAILRAGERIGEQNTTLASYNNDASSIMGGFRSKWRAIVSDWPASGADAIDEYVRHFELVVKEKLYDQENRFRDTMNRNMFEQLTSINTEIEDERENITERIRAINQVMARTELNANTHLQLKAKPVRYRFNEDYQTKVREVFAQANSANTTTADLKYARISEVIEILRKAIDPNFRNSLESRRLLDARYQFEFVAEEINKDSGLAVDTWSSSSGKSGGERETFSGLIVAASLAYVLTPDGGSAPIYSTVFLDEAFSNTSEQFGRRVIKAFREMNLHLNLITPFKNISLAREAVKSIVLVDRERGAATSNLSVVTWEYLDRKAAERLARTSVVAAPGNSALN